MSLILFQRHDPMSCVPVNSQRVERKGSGGGRKGSRRDWRDGTVGLPGLRWPARAAAAEGAGAGRKAAKVTDAPVDASGAALGGANVPGCSCGGVRCGDSAQGGCRPAVAAAGASAGALAEGALVNKVSIQRVES